MPILCFQQKKHNHCVDEGVIVCSGFLTIVFVDILKQFKSCGELRIAFDPFIEDVFIYPDLCSNLLNSKSSISSAASFLSCAFSSSISGGVFFRLLDCHLPLRGNDYSFRRISRS
jgi:hypothetical protein